MDYTIAAIPTVYDGQQYQSCPEARWDLIEYNKLDDVWKQTANMVQWHHNEYNKKISGGESE
jgi:hypothetical protein